MFFKNVDISDWKRKLTITNQHVNRFTAKNKNKNAQKTKTFFD